MEEGRRAAPRGRRAMDGARGAPAARHGFHGGTRALALRGARRGAASPRGAGCSGLAGAEGCAWTARM
eukprot:3409655-Lingulodinium_polyedra.AAC.1